MPGAKGQRTACRNVEPSLCPAMLVPPQAQPLLPSWPKNDLTEMDFFLPYSRHTRATPSESGGLGRARAACWFTAGYPVTDAGERPRREEEA